MWILPKNYPLSSAFAQAMVESKEDLSLPGLNIESSLMWRSKPSQLKTWQRRWKTTSWMPRLSGRILKPFRQKSFEEKLISSQADILASRLVQQDNERVKKTLDTCGLTSANISKQLNLLESSLKMSKDTSRLDSPQSSATWKKMVTDARGEYSARKKLAHRTDASASSSWPTPMAMDGNNMIASKEAAEKENIRTNGNVRLSGAVQLWATPNTSDAKSANMKPNKDGIPHDIEKNYLRGTVQNCQYGLTQQVQIASLQLWATPNTMDHLPQRSKEALQRQATTTRKGRTRPANLREQVNPESVAIYKHQNFPTPTVQGSDKATKKLRENHQNNLTTVVFNPQLPTPTSRDYKGGYKEESLTRADGKSRRFDALPNAAIGGVGTDVVKGHLNPDWVEALMGVPFGWTSLDGTSNEWTKGWHDGSWEQGVPRVIDKCDDRVDRIRLLGNGVVPATAAKAFSSLSAR